jgi:hypothetical protein
VVTLSGCGFFDTEEREPWRAEVEARCLASGAVVASAYVQPMKELEGPRICGLTYPFKVNALGDGSIALSKGATLSCSMIPATNAWMRDRIQPAAYMRFGMPVVELKVLASYGCRPMNNQRGAKWSEHAFGNALDVSGFKLMDGRVIDIKTSWKNGSPEEKAFLREVHAGACEHFMTVLGPGSDAFHYDHFHVDLRLHDPRGKRRVCKPVPDVAPPQPGVGLPPVPMVSAPPAATQQMVQAPQPYPAQAPYPATASYPGPVAAASRPSYLPAPPTQHQGQAWTAATDPYAVSSGVLAAGAPSMTPLPPSGGGTGIY